MMLASALDQYRKQQRITALAVVEARRISGRGSGALGRLIATYQLASAANSFEATPSLLSEQGINAPAAGAASLSSVVTGPAAVDMLNKAATKDAFDRLVATLVQDAGRTAATIDIGRRPALTGYVRSLNPPSCSRCAVLAGRVYRYSTGFQRHPRCDCLMTPTTEAIGPELITDPTDLIAKGQIRGLSQADMDALQAGADLGQVVNVRRRAAGLSEGSSVMERGGRPTPAAIMRSAADRQDVVRLLTTHGYIT